MRLCIGQFIALRRYSVPSNSIAREHGVGVVGQVPRGVEQPVLADVGGADVLEPLLDVPTADVVLHLALDDAALGVEHRQARAQLVGEAEQVELGAELAVVALLGLGQPVEVGLQLVLGRPRGAVDALQLRVLLRAAPVGGGAAHQLEGVAEHLGGRHVRAAAQVAPGAGAVAAHVVVDGQLGAAHLDGRALGRGLGRAALEADQLALVRLAGQLDEGVVVGDLAPLEGLALVDDALHDLLERAQVLGGERGLDVEVVVEAVADRRPDAQARVGVHLLHGLREHVGGRVAQHVEAVLLRRGHRLDDVAVGQHVREVAQLAVDPGDEHAAVTLEQLAGGGLLRHRSLAPGDVDGDLGRHGGTPGGVGCGGPRGRPTAKGIEAGAARCDAVTGGSPLEDTPG